MSYREWVWYNWYPGFDDTVTVDVVLDTVGQMANITFVLPYVLRHMLGVWWHECTGCNVITSMVWSHKEWIWCHMYCIWCHHIHSLWRHTIEVITLHPVHSCHHTPNIWRNTYGNTNVISAICPIVSNTTSTLSVSSNPGYQLYHTHSLYDITNYTCDIIFSMHAIRTTL